MYVFLAHSKGPAPLSLSLSTTSTQINLTEALGGVPPDQSGTADTNSGDADSTASASGGDGSYSYAWTVTETADNGQNGSSCAILAEGTKNAAQYNTATFRVTKAADIAGNPPVPVNPPPFFTEATYRLRCTVTDGNSDTATADYTVTIVNEA
jgi:hypothetical protein